MGDSSRLATYVAFKQLHERKQKELLSFWREGIEEEDRVARAIYEQNKLGTEAFVKDRPEYSKLVYWSHFILVASIFGRFGVKNPDGTRAVYGLCSHIKHSCTPNAAWFTLRNGFPKGKKVLHVINLEGITRGEEICVSEVNESVLILPKEQRAIRMFGGTGIKCECKRCIKSTDFDDEKIQRVIKQIKDWLAFRPPTDESTKEAQACLKELDKLLPFSMQLKAKAKVLLASAFGELSNRAAWQQENEGANIIQWTGLDAENQEQRLRDTKKLYETAAKDFEYLLGQDALGILNRLEVAYTPVQNQHKMIAKYQKEKEKEADTAALEEQQRAPVPAWGPRQDRGEAMPPAWDELFLGRAGSGR